MTSFAFILGCVPLAIASEPGAISQQVMGSAVIGGMLTATCLAILIIPVTFYVVEKMSHKGETGVARHAGGESEVNEVPGTPAVKEGDTHA